MDSSKRLDSRLSTLPMLTPTDITPNSQLPTAKLTTDY